MNDLDTYLIIILLYTSLAHIYLEVYEHSMKYKMALVSVAIAALFYLVVLFSWEIAHKGW